MFNVKTDEFGLLRVFFRYTKTVDRETGRPRVTTTCNVVTDGSDEAVTFGVAVCHPIDNFCKNTGRKLSLFRAIKMLGLPKEFRKKFWRAYFKARGKVG
jgi:hypothetical protein